MPRVPTLPLAGALALLAACGGSSTPTGNNNNTGGPPTMPGGSPVASANVSVENYVYSPDAVLLSAGGTVTWNWVDPGHSVTTNGSPAMPAEAPVSNPPKSLGPVTFSTTGDYQYRCSVHGVACGAYGGTGGCGMYGAIFVR